MGIGVMCWCVAGTGGVTEEQVVVVPLDLVQYDQHRAAFNTVLHHFGEVSTEHTVPRSQLGPPMSVCLEGHCEMS